MASSSEEGKVLEAAVAGIPEIAQIIAFMPVEDRARAFDTAERSYLRTVKNLGGAEELAQKWASAVMLELRAAVEERVLANRKALKALYEELIGEPVKAGALDISAEAIETDIEELIHKIYDHDTQRDS